MLNRDRIDAVGAGFGPCADTTAGNLRTLLVVSASDTERVGLPTEQVPAHVPAADPGRRAERPRLDVMAPIDVPKIVPATEPAVSDAPKADRLDDEGPTGVDISDDWDRVAANPLVVPAPQPTRQVSRRPRVRKVTRVVRHLDPWSAFKVAAVFAAVGYVASLTSAVMLWRVAVATGTIDNVERWFTQFGWETFELDGAQVFQAAWTAGLFIAVGLIGLAVLLVTVFNLVSDLVGGLRVTVLEEEVIERPGASGKRLVVSRPTAPHGPGRPVPSGRRV